MFIQNGNLYEVKPGVVLAVRIVLTAILFGLITVLFVL